MDDYLTHFGVLGMRWGVRRAGKGTVKSKTKTKKKEMVSKIKDDDLKNRINRLRLEKEYRDLKLSNGRYNKVNRKVKNIVSSTKDITSLIASSVVIYKFVKKGFNF